MIYVTISLKIYSDIKDLDFLMVSVLKSTGQEILKDIENGNGFRKLSFYLFFQKSEPHKSHTKVSIHTGFTERSNAPVTKVWLLWWILLTNYDS